MVSSPEFGARSKRLNYHPRICLTSLNSEYTENILATLEINTRSVIEKDKYPVARPQEDESGKGKIEKGCPQA